MPSNPYVQHPPRVRHTDVEKALARLNAARGFKYPDVGYTYYADIKGDGGPPQRRCWTIINDKGGVRQAYDLQAGTMRKIIANIETHLSALKG